MDIHGLVVRYITLLILMVTLVSCFDTLRLRKSFHKKRNFPGRAKLNVNEFSSTWRSQARRDDVQFRSIGDHNDLIANRLNAYRNGIRRRQSRTYRPRLLKGVMTGIREAFN